MPDEPKPNTSVFASKNEGSVIAGIPDDSFSKGEITTHTITRPTKEEHAEAGAGEGTDGGEGVKESDKGGGEASSEAKETGDDSDGSSKPDNSEATPGGKKYQTIEDAERAANEAAKKMHAATQEAANLKKELEEKLKNPPKGSEESQMPKEQREQLIESINQEFYDVGPAVFFDKYLPLVLERMLDSKVDTISNKVVTISTLREFQKAHPDFTELKPKIEEVIEGYPKWYNEQGADKLEKAYIVAKEYGGDLIKYLTSQKTKIATPPAAPDNLKGGVKVPIVKKTAEEEIADSIVDARPKRSFSTL